MTYTRQAPALRCTLCGREITLGEEYWSCNGHRCCYDCLPELAPCREVRGREGRL